uniref:Solute carrier organic anion transporter family member n=1 Tax=Panagrolaimus superbus TaxID=310955 RepID=A0A914Z305_9BILA
MVSAVQSIERQFQIPSKLSGFISSASDISYIPTVVFISYFGGKGNRAKWIGAGCVLIAFAHIMTATPNFIFPVKAPDLNLTKIEQQLNPSPNLLAENVTLKELFEFQPLKDRIPSKTREIVLQKFNGHSISERAIEDMKLKYTNHSNNSPYTVDDELINEAMYHFEEILHGNENDPKNVIAILRQFVVNRTKDHKNDLKTVRRAAIAHFAFCGKLVNDLRDTVDQLKCFRDGGNFGPLLIIFCALLGLGIGRTMPWSLGIPLIDDNVKRKSMPVYFAGISFIRILGPITGFLIGSFCNKLYFTAPAPPPAGLTPSDPTWIGAWWLGFLIIGFANIIPSLALFFFPTGDKSNKIVDSEVSTTKKRQSLKLFDRHKDENKKNNIGGREEDKTASDKFKTFATSYKEVVKSKVYMGSVIGRVMDVLAFKGYMFFLPKFLENHFGLPQYKVQQYMAMFGVFGFACGTLCGGLITRKFKLNGRNAAFFVFAISVANTAVFFSKSFLGCHSVVNGIGRDGVATNFNYTTSCNSECGCHSAKLFPVCDSAGNAFYSPCHAGCRHVSVQDLETQKLEFTNCDCAVNGIVKKELCHDDCKIMWKVFFGTIILGAFIAGTGVVPGMLILLRSVPPSTRSQSLGLQGFLVSLFGTLPSPVLWGALIDSACLVWDRSCTSSRGACAIYDPYILRMRMHIVYVCIRLVSCLTDLYVWYYAKDLNILEEEEEEDAKKTDIEKTEKDAAEVLEKDGAIPLQPLQ